MLRGYRTERPGLVQYGLVDEYRLLVFPIILGAGKRLFPDEMSAAATLTLADSKTGSDGVLLLTYRPAPAEAPVGQPARGRVRVSADLEPGEQLRHALVGVVDAALHAGGNHPVPVLHRLEARDGAHQRAAVAFGQGERLQ